jgi:hypothetical protein
MQASFHPAYFATRFHGPWPDSVCPQEFVILTAFATTGETWSKEANRVADRALEEVLRATGAWMRRLTGYDPATGHAEAGWAVALDFDTAREIGRRFHQDAIFEISGDELRVTRCQGEGGSAVIGSFRERLDGPPGTARANG